MLTKDELPECPVATTVQLIGNKWKLLILRNLIYKDKQRFTDFLKTVPAISKRVLTDNLRSLENNSLSPLGKTLKPVLDAMWRWGTDYKNNL